MKNISLLVVFLSAFIFTSCKKSSETPQPLEPDVAKRVSGTYNVYSITVNNVEQSGKGGKFVVSQAGTLKVYMEFSVFYAGNGFSDKGNFNLKEQAGVIALLDPQDGQQYGFFKDNEFWVDTFDENFRTLVIKAKK